MAGMPKDADVFVLNKPAGVLTSKKDPKGRPTVFAHVPPAPGLTYVGRLDYLTEGVLLHDSDQNAETLRQLKNLGVAISLDDFGVGYSSLSYLTSFSFDKVKIDRSFVEKLDRPESRAILSSIEQLSRTLNLTTCVEGVETVAQFEHIRTLGIDLCQGYLFSKPKPFSELSFDDHAMQRALNAA